MSGRSRSEVQVLDEHEDSSRVGEHKKARAIQATVADSGKDGAIQSVNSQRPRNPC
jgi:hypothetical protein